MAAIIPSASAAAPVSPAGAPARRPPEPPEWARFRERLLAHVPRPRIVHLRSPADLATAGATGEIHLLSLDPGATFSLAALRPLVASHRPFVSLDSHGSDLPSLAGGYRWFSLARTPRRFRLFGPRRIRAVETAGRAGPLLAVPEESLPHLLRATLRA